MPVRLPGGRKRATPAERQWFAQKNTIKPCGADHWHKPRIWTRRYCIQHRGHLYFHGHPDGRALETRLVWKWRRIMREFLTRYNVTSSPAAI